MDLVIAQNVPSAPKKTGEQHQFQFEQEFKPEPKKTNQGPNLTINPKIQALKERIAERRRESNHFQQDTKESIAKQGLEKNEPNEVVPQTHNKVAKGQTGNLKMFTKHYIEQGRGK